MLCGDNSSPATKECEEMIETENDTNGSSVIYSSDLINPTMQFEGMFVGLLVTYIFGKPYVYQYILCLFRV